MNILFALVCGLVFGVGLIVAGMANPAKVVGFLDLAGNWDPSLAFVMGGAIAVSLPAFAFARRKSLSLLDLPMQLPAARRLDRRLMAGSVLFGIGWGLAGICPGPALTLLGAGSAKGLAFVTAMFVGMAVFELLESRKTATAAAAQQAR